MKIKNLTLISLLLLTILSCNNNIKKTNNLRYSYTVDTLFYKDGLDLRESSGSINALDIKIIKDSVYLIVKSLKSDTLYCFSYNDKLILNKKYCLTKDYNDSSIFGKVKSISIINKDSLLILQDKRISIFSTKLLKSVNEYNSKDNWLNVCLCNPIIWDNSSKTIYNELIRYDVPEKDGVMQTELISSLNIQKKKQIALPIYYNPKVDIKNNLNLFMSFTLMEDEKKIIAGFSTISEVYVLDLKTNRVKIKSLNSSNENDIIKSDIKNNGYDSAKEDFIKSFLYLNSFYDLEKHILFRSYLLSAVSKKRELNKTISDKNFGFVAFDKNFEYIGEIVIENIKSMPMMFFANSGSIYVQLNADLKRNYMRFLKIKYEL